MFQARPSTALLLSLALWATCAAADSQAQSGKAPKISPAERFEIVRTFNAEQVFVRRSFPMGEAGLTLTPEGKLSPSGEQLERVLATLGPAAKAGERVRISKVEFKGRRIIFDINGGPKKKKKWYERVQVSGASGVSVSPGSTSPGKEDARGTMLLLEFEDYVPGMTPQQLRELLAPVFDFKSVTAVQAYLDTLPPKAREAIKNHQALVGMNREMVIHAKGRPPRKIREKDEEGNEYEEWIYGQPPQAVEFIRFIGDEVVRLAVMQVDGAKVVRTEKEVDLGEAWAKKEETPPPAPSRAPTLRRPGEDAANPPVVIQVPAGQPGGGTQDPTIGPPPPQAEPGPPR